VTISLGTASESASVWTIRAPRESPLPAPCLVLVRNDDDGQPVRRHLKFFGATAARRMPCPQVLVRPTPAAVDQTTFGLDVLTALGKNPEVLAAERLGPDAWIYARAWLAAVAVSDLVIDRAHQLSAARVRELGALAGDLGCRVWLIWSGGGDLAAVVDAAHAADVRRVSVMPAWLPDLLPVPAPAPAPNYQLKDTVLPSAEFTTFRAAARRHLAPREFERLDRLYQHAATRTDAWLAEHQHLREAGRQELGGPLAAWLRDDQLGPHHRPGDALITLRATQAALFVGGVLLRWDPATLGPDPAARLCGTIDVRHRVHGLYAGARTAPAAVTALSLHLNQPPLYFDCWRLADVSADGSVLTPPGVHRHKVLAYLSYPDYRAAIDGASGVTEIACAQPVRVPAPARVLLAAHHAHRRQQGAAATDPFFVNPANPGEPATHSGMREHAVRTTAQLHRTPPWLHRDPCRFGADIGLHRRPFGWLIERGLSVHILDADLVDRLPHPVRRAQWS
jgi:hypothetical protein